MALRGPFNVANALGAIVALVEAGIGLDDAVAGVAACPGVPGRLEAGRAPAAPHCRLDRAGGLLAQARRGRGGAERAAPGHPGQLIIVLGCGGDRDRAKRPLMGAAAAALADVAIFTSDNPRSEDPLAILAAMLEGALGVPQQRART